MPLKRKNNNKCKFYAFIMHFEHPETVFRTDSTKNSVSEVLPRSKKLNTHFNSEQGLTSVCLLVFCLFSPGPYNFEPDLPENFALNYCYDDKYTALYYD